MRRERSSAAVEASFWRRLDLNSEGRPWFKGTQCWVWTGAKMPEGYGIFTIDGHEVRAHRFAWNKFEGEIPEGLCVLHHCDNPPCCNPEHLFLGTPTDNTKDRDRKRRQAHGESHGRAKITDEQAQEIRERYRAGGLKQTDLAREYGVSQSTITRVVTRKNWRHVE